MKDRLCKVALQNSDRTVLALSNVLQNSGSSGCKDYFLTDNITIGRSRVAVRGTRPPPMGPNSFIFAYIFSEKCLHRRSTPPLMGPHAPSGT